MTFEFVSAGRIIFGRGALSKVGPLAAGMGTRVCVVSGRNTQRSRPLTQELGANGLHWTVFSVPGEPTTDTVMEGAAHARSEETDLVIGMGGGSVVDAGKAIAALLTNEGNLLDYLEVIGQGRALTQRPAPYVAIPTTAGTGAEVTKNAVIESPEHRVKVSMRSPLMVPQVAVVDPELTLSMSREVTAFTGLDALTQLIEAFVSKKATPLTDGICREGLIRVTALPRACADGSDGDAREAMSLSSLFSGLVLTNGGLGAVHGFAGPFGGMFPAPHGAVCAALLPHVMGANISALKKAADGQATLARYDDIARILTGDPVAGAGDGVDWVRRICEDLEVPSLTGLGLTTSEIPNLVEKAQKASSMKGNPVSLNETDLTRILENAL